LGDYWSGDDFKIKKKKTTKITRRKPSNDIEGAQVFISWPNHKLPDQEIDILPPKLFPKG
jgi:hypothetical protein